MDQAESTPRLNKKRVLLGVSGGIASYKSCTLASLLVKEGATVSTVLTRNARRFVTPHTFEALTGNPCRTHTFKRISGGETAYPHIDPAEEAELAVLAPATANLIARLAHGLADELLPTLCLSLRCPVLICPAMNVRMWEHPATQRNIQTLASFGHKILGPESGTLACGMTGAGRMVEPEEILKVICRLLTRQPDSGSQPGKGAKGRGSRSKTGKTTKSRKGRRPGKKKRG